MIVGVTPDGRMAVVAGTGPKGFGDGDGRAARARLGLVDALAVGPDGDLYVSESAPRERVRRIADPAGILAAPRAEPDQPEPAPACAEIADLMVAAVGVGRRRDALERSLNALGGRRARGDPRRRATRSRRAPPTRPPPASRSAPR